MLLRKSGRIIMHADFMHGIQMWKEIPPTFRPQDELCAELCI